jgi:hypothetical protein
VFALGLFVGRYFEQHDALAPNVALGRVVFDVRAAVGYFKYFRRHVQRGAHECFVFALDVRFGEPEIAQLYVAVAIDLNIFALDISVTYMLAMELVY